MLIAQVLYGIDGDSLSAKASMTEVFDCIQVSTLCCLEKKLLLLRMRRVCGATAPLLCASLAMMALLYTCFDRVCVLPLQL
jgi:hypothetical protein